MNLSEFLLARIAEDEVQAREDYANGMTGHLWKHLPKDAYDAIQSITLDRGRRLAAECEAKRQIVDLHSVEHECVAAGRVASVLIAPGYKYFPDPTLRLLALPYADHPDYRDEWRP